MKNSKRRVLKVMLRAQQRRLESEFSDRLARMRELLKQQRKIDMDAKDIVLMETCLRHDAHVRELNRQLDYWKDMAKPAFEKMFGDHEQGPENAG